MLVTVIDADLSTRIEPMVGFHNIAAHDYEAIDARILERSVAERLAKLEAFADAVTPLVGGGDA